MGVSGCQQFQGVTGVSIVVSMGNSQARQRIKARDFEYLAKNTRFATLELVEEYFDTLMEKYPDGKMEVDDFKKTFFIAFPAKPEEKVEKLSERLANKDGKISMANMLILFYLFSADGNKIITLNELYEIMAVFIEISEGKDNQIDLAKTMAEMFKVADKNKDDVMDLKEFQTGVMEHPLTAKIFRIKTIDALLEVMV